MTDKRNDQKITAVKNNGQEFYIDITEKISNLLTKQQPRDGRIVFDIIVREFITAARLNDLETVRQLVSAQFPVDETCDLNDLTALHLFASYGNYKAVEFLIESGADPLLEDVHGRTASLVAIDCKYYETSMYLAQKEGERLRKNRTYVL